MIAGSAKERIKLLILAFASLESTDVCDISSFPSPAQGAALRKSALYFVL